MLTVISWDSFLYLKQASSLSNLYCTAENLNFLLVFKKKLFSFCQWSWIFHLYFAFFAMLRSDLSYIIGISIATPNFSAFWLYWLAKPDRISQNKLRFLCFNTSYPQNVFHFLITSCCLRRATDFCIWCGVCHLGAEITCINHIGQLYPILTTSYSRMLPVRFTKRCWCVTQGWMWLMNRCVPNYAAMLLRCQNPVTSCEVCQRSFLRIFDKLHVCLLRVTL